MNKGIFDVIKSDDIKLFDECAQRDKSVLSLCYGRFPLLSLCYLYNARKIIRWYEKKLNVSTYVYVAEEQGMYEDFKAKAQKSVRLYTEEGAIVSPLEMLAALNSPHLAAAYPVLRKTEPIKSNILKIYQSIHGQDITLTDNNIKLPKAPLTKFKKRLVAAIVAVALIFAVLPLASWAAIQNSLGKGTESNPYAISSVRQFEHIFKEKDKNYVLKKDITLPKNFKGGDFSGALDGKGKTIYLSNPDASLFATLSGVLINVNFVISLDATLTASSSFIASINSGVMDNVAAKLDADLNLSGSLNVEISCFSHTNYGIIQNSNISVDVEFSVSEEGGGAFSTFAVNNYGTIKNCTVAEGSAIVSDTVDTSGIAVWNLYGGEITDCVNNAEITQTTSRDDWYALAAGITLENHGTLNGCINNGSLTVNLLSQTETALEVRVGGIAYANLNVIEKCKNTADITVHSKSFDTYAGGIAAINAAGYIRQCGSSGGIAVSSDFEDGVEFYCGGIVGYNGIYLNNWNQIVAYGFVSECFSSVAFAGSNKNAYFGGISGLWYKLYPEQFSNNFYLKALNVDFGVDSYIGEDGFAATEEEFDGLTGVNSLADLQATEVYW